MNDEYVFPPPPRTFAQITNSEQKFPVRRVFCVGRNYSQHVHEMGGNPDHDQPIFFSKPACALVASHTMIEYPLSCTELHHEVELVAAISKPLRNTDQENARNAVFGLAVGIDLTRRDLQHQAKSNGLPWDCAKAFDQSAPMGSILPVPNLPTKLEGQIELSVNGARRQCGNLNQMIWKIPQLLVHLSRLFQLEPGDLVFTGTPHGVGPLVRGDKISASIAGVGDVHFQIAFSE